MIHSRPNVRKLLSCLLFVTIFSSTNSIWAQDGTALFRSNCASCHALNKALTGPALAGFNTRGQWSDRKQLHAWVHNPTAYMAKDPYTQGLKAQYNSMMQAFPGLADKDIDAIAEYIIKASAVPVDGGGGNNGD